MSENSSAPAPQSAPVESAPVDSSTSTVQSQDNSQPNLNEIAEAVESGEISASTAQKMIKKFKLKVDGETSDMEIDLSDEDAVRNELQLAAVSRKRMAETANVKKAYQREMERLKNDPWSVLAEMGLDPEELSTGFISKKIEEMKKSPEQLASEKLQKDLDAAYAKIKASEEKEQQAEMAKLNEQATKSLNDEIDRAISGHKKLPNSPLVRKKIADSMLWAINQDPEKYGNITAEDVIPMVEKELRAELGGLFEGLEDDAFEEWVGRERLNKARKKKVAARVPGLSDVKTTAAAMKPSASEEAPAKKVKAKDLFRTLGRN